MTARVVRVQSDSSDPQWEITVARDGDSHSGDPDPRDVPGDVRRALRLWLDEARSTEGIL